MVQKPTENHENSRYTLILGPDQTHIPPHPRKATESDYPCIYYRTESSARSPYLGYYYINKLQPSGKLKSVAVRKRFQTEAQRSKWAAKTVATRRANGQSSRALDPSRVKRWEIADELLGLHLDPVEVIRDYRDYLANREGTLRRNEDLGSRPAIIPRDQTRREVD